VEELIHCKNVVQTINAEEISEFSFQDAMAFVGAEEMVEA